MNEPLKLAAPLKDYLWGGTKLKTEYHKASDLEKVAESWELSCHPDGVSVIKNGTWKDRRLTEFLETHPNVLGLRAKRFEQFPILIKLIDAADHLSVQVHPDNEYALRVEGEYGKTELWYVVEAEEGAELIYGFRRPISQEEFQERIQNNTLLEVVNRVPVKAGDVFFIEAGTLHGIGKGILIAEIQQNSNTTYRVYDYGRVGADGNPRELHIEKALQVTNREVSAASGTPVGKRQELEGHACTPLSVCEYFEVTAVEVWEEAAFYADETSFHALLVLDGMLELDYGFGSLGLIRGDSVFIPAALGEYELIGTGSVLLTTIGKEKE